MKLLMVLPLVAVVFAGCASTAVDNAYAGASRYPMSQRPAYFKSLYDAGKLNQKQYSELMLTWEQMDSEQKQEQATLAAMTPGERAIYRQNQDVITNQQRQIAMQQNESEMAALRHATSSGSAQARSNAQILSDTANTQAIVNAVGAQQ